MFNTWKEVPILGENSIIKIETKEVKSEENGI